MIAPPLLLALAAAYLLLLFAVAWWGDRRAAQGRSVVGNAWVYALSMAVYCSAWTYFGSVGRAASGGVWFLPVYLGPMLAMLLAWSVLRKMIRIARRYRLTSIADLVASRYGQSPQLAGLVTLVTLVGIVPYIALQLKAVAIGYAVLTGDGSASAPTASIDWWRDGTFYAALALAGFTMVFGTRHLDSTERHEGMVAAIAFESLVKLVAFVAVGVFVTWGLYDGFGDLYARAAAVPALEPLFTFARPDQPHAHAQWFALTLLSMLSLLLLPRQFQVMVVENVDERHLKRAAWVFPAYLLAINLFVLPIALAGLLSFPDGSVHADTFVLSLPMSEGQTALALAAFVGGLSAATGMVIVEAIAVSTMVCNDLVMPVLLRRGGLADGAELAGRLLWIRRAAIFVVLMLGYLYYHFAGDAYALVGIGLISFAAVAQFAPAVLGGLYWKGGTRRGAIAGLSGGFALWIYTLMLPSLAKSGWWPASFLEQGPFGIGLLKPEALFGLAGLDYLTHALFWSLLVNAGLYVAVSLARPPTPREASQALLFVDVFDRSPGDAPVFWRGRANLADLRALAIRFLGADNAGRLFEDYAREQGVSSVDRLQPDARLVLHVQTQLAGAIGSASAQATVASVVEEEALDMADVMRIVEEATALRAHSAALEAAGEELRAANERLESLDRLKDDFMSSVTHELRTPLTSIRGLSELMRDDPEMPEPQRQQFLGIVVAETERLSRLVNQVLDMAKIESGHAEWLSADIDLVALVRQAAVTMQELMREKRIALELHLPESVPTLRADPDRLTQVVINLLSNAAKFARGGGEGRIELRLSADADGATVEVQDNGAGVPDGQRALIFEKFRQGGDDRHRPQGTGLGLPISRSIVEHFGGRMMLKPDEGRGACFVFTLPWRGPAAGGDAAQATDTTRRGDSR